MFRARQYAVFLAFILFFLTIFFRLFYLQIINSRKFAVMAKCQHAKTLKIEPTRGSIYDRNLEPLATSLETPSVFADPKAVRDKKGASSFLSSALALDEAAVLKLLAKDRSFVWIKRKINPDPARKIKDKKLEGIYVVNESKRFYPNDSMASHLVGFAGVDNSGLEGVELLYDSQLRGKPGVASFIRDARLRPVLLMERESLPQEDGNNVVLTVDSVIQFIVEEELLQMARKHNAESASAIVMDPDTGEVLAMANYPAYNLNSPAGPAKDPIKNSSISDVFEPGSAFKIVAIGASLSENVCKKDDVFDCENGNYTVGGRVLHDFHPYGKLTLDQVVAKSSNIGTVKVAEKLGAASLYRYICDFGFGEKTGIDLPGEAAGINRPPEQWSKSDISTVPIGQGIAVTPIQLVSAMSIIANGGRLLKPYVVDRITTWDGKTISKTRPVERRRVLSKAACDRMKDFLEEVVLTGTGVPASSKLYKVCGKTGTAQVVNPLGGYYPNKYNATFLGFAPKDKPRLSVVVVARKPHPVYFGGNVAGPAFKRIVERSLQYLESNGRRTN